MGRAKGTHSNGEAPGDKHATVGAATAPGLRARKTDGVTGASALEMKPSNGNCGPKEGVGSLNRACHLFLCGPQAKNGFHIF